MSRTHPVDDNERVFWERATRFEDAGLGFWRLVGIVACGILLAEAVTAVLVGIVLSLR